MEIENLRKDFFKEYNKLYEDYADYFKNFYIEKINDFLYQNADEYSFYDEIQSIEYNNYEDTLNDYRVTLYNSLSVYDGKDWHNYSAEENLDTNEPISGLYEFLLKLIPEFELKILFKDSISIDL